MILDKSNHPFLESGDLAVFKKSSLELAVGKITLVIDYTYKLIGELNKCNDKLLIITFDKEITLFETEKPKFFILEQLIK